MIIRSEKELKRYQEAAAKSMQILQALFEAVQENVTPLEIDQLAEKKCQELGVTPCFKGVGPKNNQYQWATCISVNDAVVHGIPDDVPLKKGDLIKVDFGINDAGWFTDHCFTKSVGEPNKADLNLMKVARKAIQAAAQMAVAGKRTGDLGAKIQQTVEEAGLSVVKEFVGHGIGHTMHDSPQLPAHGRAHTGAKLKEGMVLCVEAQILDSENDDIFVEENGWTVRSDDGAKAAMFEYMVVVGKKKPTILTNTLNWPLH